MALTPDAWLTLFTIAGCFSLLIFSRLPADAILVAGVALLLFLNVITPQEALVGMANEGMATVGVLFVVAQALVQTGVVAWVSQHLLGRPKTAFTAQLRLMLPVAGLSSVLNNTPVVAMLVPAVSDWAKRNQLSVSQLMMPLSFAAIIGGTCTLIGTSTNLVVNGMLMDFDGGRSLGMFELAWVGIPATVMVIAFIAVFARWLLPHERAGGERFEDARQYIVEMVLEPGSPLAGLSIEEAGLRHLPGMYLIEIGRDGQLIAVVSPRETLRENDRLIFAGDVRSVVDLKNIRGLKLAEDHSFKLGKLDDARCLVEVVVSPQFPFLGKTVRDSRFRNHYSAAIIAVARNGEHIKTRIGDIELRPGDTLLLETQDDFVRRQRYSRDFLLVSRIENSEPVRYHKQGVAAAILGAMVLSVAFGVLSMFKASLLAAGLMALTRCIRVQEARRSIDWQVLLVIAASIALGGALDKTGAAQVIAEQMIEMAAGSAMTTLATTFILTAVFSAVISNLAAAVLVFPVILSASEQLDVALMPFAVTVMMAASTCFATPIGYQTNLMVYGPGGYRFVDFVRLGLPLTVLVGVTTVLIVPLVWPL